MLCVDPTDAPFFCSAKPQSSVAPNIVAAEHYCAGSGTVDTPHFRMLADELQFPQPSTVMFLDSKSALHLANAHAVTKKVRHMKATYYPRNGR